MLPRTADIPDSGAPWTSRMKRVLQPLMQAARAPPERLLYVSLIASLAWTR